MKKNNYLHFSSEDEDNGSVESYASSIKEDNIDTLYLLIRFFYYLIHIVPPDQHHGNDIDNYITVLNKVSKLDDNNKVIWFWENKELFQYSEENIQLIYELIEKYTFDIYNRKTIEIEEKDYYDTQEILNEFYILFKYKKITQYQKDNVYLCCLNSKNSDNYKDKVYTNYILELFYK